MMILVIFIYSHHICSLCSLPCMCDLEGEGVIVRAIHQKRQCLGFGPAVSRECLMKYSLAIGRFKMAFAMTDG